MQALLHLPPAQARWLRSRPGASVVALAQVTAATIGVGIAVSGGIGLLAVIWLLLIPVVLVALVGLSKKLEEHEPVTIVATNPRPSFPIRSTEPSVAWRPPNA